MFRTWLHDANTLLRVSLVSGLVFRLWHYLVNHTIWYDEAVLLDNILSKDFGALLGPLRNEVAAPPLFLWLLKSIHLLFGDEPYIWRLVPLFGSVGTLLLTVPVAKRLLNPAAAAFAVTLVACSDNHIWLGCTIKPYATDAFLATGLLLSACSIRRENLTRRWLLIAAISPILIGFSYPMLFVLGAMLLAWGPMTYRNGPRSWVAWMLAAAIIGTTFLLLYFGPIQAQRVAKLVNEWERFYPNFRDPIRLPIWFAIQLDGVFQYAFHPVGAVLVLFAPLGVFRMWHSSRSEFGTFCLGVFCVVLVASAARSYPFGQNRLMLFIAPFALLTLAKGLERQLESTKWMKALAVVSILVEGALCYWHIAVPWSQPDAQSVHRLVLQQRLPTDAILSDEGNYLYFFHGEVQPLSEAAQVPVGRRAWVVMDLYPPEECRGYIEARLKPLGFQPVKEWQFHDAGAYLWERTAPRNP